MSHLAGRQESSTGLEQHISHPSTVTEGPRVAALLLTVGTAKSAS